MASIYRIRMYKGGRGEDYGEKERGGPQRGPGETGFGRGGQEGAAFFGGFPWGRGVFLYFGRNFFFLLMGGKTEGIILFLPLLLSESFFKFLSSLY